MTVENIARDTPLIGPDDPEPFELLNPESGLPVLLICDHASKTVPQEMANLGLDEATMDLHVGWDIGAAEVVRQLA
ncbi:MAG TPA: N-formylglutamate amidohydrolase, partial [Rhodospirillales bacterium]|nr:N-formylglutamate amidohydrolase [Rhodospirillales bacterium]